MNRVVGRALVIVFCAGLPGATLMHATPWATAVLAAVTQAQAAEDGHSVTGHSGPGGAGHSLPRGHSAGTDGGHAHEAGDDGHSGATAKGRGGQRGAHDSRGAARDSARGGEQSVEHRVFGGGRPVWAQEGIPEVELGRLNVARAPGQVLARAEAEALAAYTEAMAPLYASTAEEAAALLAANYRDLARIDSPLQNLALYRDVMVFGRSQLPGVTGNRLDTAAIFLGSAADKNLPIGEDTVIAINRILGLVELSDAERATLAAKAEGVRAAILAGHGDAAH